MVELGPLSKKEYDLVILFSGGADSVLMLEMSTEFGYTPHCVLIDYEQLHKEELEYAKKYLEHKGYSYRIVKLHDLGINSGLTGDGIKDTSNVVHEMHVPSRNLMFIGIAASIAEDLGADLIWMGADWDDYLNEFPDCKQEWIGRVGKVLEINGPKNIKLEAPLLGLSKKSILKSLKTIGVNLNEIYSGYGDL